MEVELSREKGKWKRGKGEMCKLPDTLMDPKSVILHGAPRSACGEVAFQPSDSVSLCCQSHTDLHFILSQITNIC